MEYEAQNILQLLETDAEKIYDDVIMLLEKYCGEPLYPGDERRIFGEALVQVIVAVYNKVNDTAKQSLLRYARGLVLDALGERSQTERLQGKPATVTMRMNVAAPMGINVIIPLGTRVTPDGVLYFATSTAAVIQAGAVLVDIVAVATVPGAEHNDFPIGAINTLVDLIPYVSGVANIGASRGGDSGEPYTEQGDDHYRERIRLAPGKRSTAGTQSAYKYWAMTVSAEICDVKAVSPSPGVVTVIPLLNNGVIPDDAMLEEVQKVVAADDIAPMTDTVNVEPPEVIVYDIELVYYTSKVLEAEVVQNIEGSGGAIDRYNDWQMQALGRDINPDQLRKLILSPDCGSGLSGADRLELIKPEFKQVGDTQVAQWGKKIKVNHVAL